MESCQSSLADTGITRTSKDGSNSLKCSAYYGARNGAYYGAHYGALCYAFFMRYLLLLLICSGCGQGGSCPLQPTTCGPNEYYGHQCLTYTEYKSAGFDVIQDAKTCNLAGIAGFGNEK